MGSCASICHRGAVGLSKAHSLPDEVELKPTSTDRETPTTNTAGLHKLKYPFSQNLSQNKNSSKLKPPILHGLIVGINKYKQSEVHPDLLGCVSDAKSMLNYFTGLGIPKDRFLCLYDEDATRDAILKAFVNNLINNPNIQKFDPIVIYFAGYGDRVQAPRGWQTVNGFAGMILPHDTSTFDALGHYIHGIPDLTLAFLLYRLSQDKGNNITVILDSCHSQSDTRGEFRSRSSHDPGGPPIPIDLDLELRKSLSVDYPSEVERDVTSKQTSRALAPSLESHVLLAACRDDEQAYEALNVNLSGRAVGDRLAYGLFTTSLLKELKKSNLATTSYTTLIHNLLANPEYRPPESSQAFGTQTFQCEGRNQDRLLFSVQYSISEGKMSLIPTRDQSIYRVRIGSAQGVVPGTEFGVFSSGMNRAAVSHLLTTLVATDVGPMVSNLCSPEPDNPPTLPDNAYVSIISYNDHSNGVRIWVDQKIRQDMLWQRILSGLDSLPIFWATSPNKHDIELLFSDGDMEIRGAHLTPGQFGNSCILRCQLDFKRLVEMLTAVIYFHFHLKHQNKDAPVREHLSMVLRELKSNRSSWGTSVYEAEGEDLFGDSVIYGTVATLYPDPYKVLGLELINSSQEDLFPYVLYYDFEDYSVGCIYEPPGRSVKAPLPAGKSLAIGYGSGGSQPFQVDFTNPKSNKEYGAFVLLVFSEWVDIWYLQQESPFGSISLGRGGMQRGRSRSTIWDSLVVRVEVIKQNNIQIETRTTGSSVFPYIRSI